MNYEPLSFSYLKLDLKRINCNTIFSFFFFFLGEFHLRLRHLEKSLLQALNDAKGRILDDDRWVWNFKKLNFFVCFFPCLGTFLSQILLSKLKLKGISKVLYVVSPYIVTVTLRGQRGRVVRAPASKSGGRELSLALNTL